MIKKVPVRKCYASSVAGGKAMKKIINMSKTGKQGFTLMELIVVMTILAIITVGLFGTFSSSQKKSRDSQRKSDLKQLQNALEMYANDHKGLYPNASSGLIKGCPSNKTDTDGTACSWGSGEFRITDEAIYLKKMVKDPVTNSNYYYVVATGNTSYKLYACLENNKDPVYKTAGYTGTDCGPCVNVNLCAYGVSSSNVTP